MASAPATHKLSVPLDAVLRTAVLSQRPSRPVDYQAESRALLELAQHLADSPRTILQKLADILLREFGAGSAGVSLVSKETGDFYWPAISGAWQPHIGEGTPRDFGPCGIVLDRNAVQLFAHPERAYPYLAVASPAIEEVLLSPFHVKGTAVGTVWVVSHGAARKFDLEDQRLLVSLGTFASAAYQTLESLEALEQERAQLGEHDAVAQRAREHAEATLRTSPVPLLVLESDLTVVTGNEAFYRRFQVEPAQTEGRKIYDLGNRQWDIPQLRALLEEVLPQQRSFEQYDVTHDFESIGRRTMLLNARRMEVEAGGPERIVLVLEDISERKQAHAAEAALAAIVQNSDDAIISKGLDGVITSWNAGAERVFGYTAAEAVGRPITMLIPPDRQDEEPRIIERLKRGERVDHFETRRVRKDGSLIDISLTISPVRDETGRVVGASKIARDISERKRAEQALRESEDQLRLITDAVPGLISYIDRDLVYRFVNRQYEEWFHDAPGEIVGKSVYDVLGEAAMAHLRPHMDQALGGEAARFEDEVPYREGGMRWIDAQYIPHRDEQGRVQGIFVMVLDITQRKQTEEALQESDRRKSEFLAVLAHELRNPLAPIRNAALVLGSSAGDPEVVQSTTDMLQRQVNQMARLVDDLLDISRISRGKIELHKERIELASVVHHTLEAIRPASEFKEQVLTLAQPQEPIYLDADPVRLAQIVGNLLTNASKFSDRGGHICLTIERAGSEVVIAVQDDGIGIASHQLAHIFEMFTQIDTSLERSQSGLGIGLTLAKNLVEMHGGTIEARSAGSGRGSEFIVRLPVAQAPQPVPAEQEPVAARTVARRILVVDDNRDAALSLAMLLKLGGHKVHLAHDGLAAVEAAAKLQPEVILLDIGLPKLNGYEAARRIRQQQKNGLLLVALTGWGQEEDRKRSKEAGFDVHLVKPVELSTLTRLLEGGAE